MPTAVIDILKEWMDPAPGNDMLRAFIAPEIDKDAESAFGRCDRYALLLAWLIPGGVVQLDEKNFHSDELRPFSSVPRAWKPCKKHYTHEFSDYILSRFS